MDIFLPCSGGSEPPICCTAVPIIWRDLGRFSIFLSHCNNAKARHALNETGAARRQPRPNLAETRRFRPWSGQPTQPNFRRTDNAIIEQSSGRDGMNKIGAHALVWVGGWSHAEADPGDREDGGPGLRHHRNPGPRPHHHRSRPYPRRWRKPTSSASPCPSASTAAPISPARIRRRSSAAKSCCAMP